jgi:hypothetical protein
MPQSKASREPAMESWSVMAMAPKFRRKAKARISAGESVPSEALE